MTASSMPLDPVRAGLDRALHSLAALGPDLAGHANRIGAILWSPPRIVIVGRLKAGKSTLVNALIGAKIADTAALEATNVVSVYQEGAPARAEAVLLDGTRAPVRTDRGRSTASTSRRTTSPTYTGGCPPPQSATTPSSTPLVLRR